MVLPCLGTRNRSFLARSTPFWMASGTSLALPYPTPTTSRSSPTTTRAVNEKRRPPFTTLATRLISTTRSWRSRPDWLTDRSTEMDIGSERVAAERLAPLDGDARLANGFGERTGVTVEAIAAAIEYGFGDTGSLGPLGERLAGAPGALGLRQGAKLGLEPVHGRERAPRGVVDQLRGQPPVGAEHRDPRA